MIKEKRHPTGFIDITIVPSSKVMEAPLKIALGYPSNHHVLIVDMGETT